MDKQILENHINSLKKACDACRSQLDTGAMKELDGAITTLEQLRDHPQGAVDAETLKLRALQAIAAFVTIMTNIRDWL